MTADPNKESTAISFGRCDPAPHPLILEKQNLQRNATGDRRLLIRSKQQASLEYRAVLREATGSVACEVVDVHCGGIGVRVPGRSAAIRTQAVRMELFFGQRALASMDHVSLVWTAGDRAGFQFDTASARAAFATYETRPVRPSFTPVVIAADPFHMGLALNLRVREIGENAMLLETSLSNRHILDGTSFHSALLVLPGIGTTSVDFDVAYATADRQTIQVAGIFRRLSADGKKLLAQFFTFGLSVSYEMDSDAQIRELARSLQAIRQSGSAVRVENAGTATDYDAILRLRLDAYRSAGILQPDVSVSDMADEYDARSIIVVTKVNGLVVGTGRLIRCIDDKDRFLFEKDIPFETLGLERRQDFLEISRLAVHPALHGTDIVTKMFQEFVRQCTLNGKTALALGRTTQRKSYARMGMQTVSHELPHPLLAGETLAVMLLSPADFLAGRRMAPITRNLLLRDIIGTVVYANLLSPPKTQSLPKSRAVMEFLALWFASLRKPRARKRNIIKSTTETRSNVVDVTE
jgi:hypothetical protein